MADSNKVNIEKYYTQRESRWGYSFLLKGTKHYGFYPQGKNAGLSLHQAQDLMEKNLAYTLDLPKGSVVLDAGCGEGHVAIHLTKSFGYKVYGIDLLELSIDAANRNKKKLELLEPIFKLMDYSETDFPDDFFDGIYTIETLVHASDYKKTLKEFYRILKPGGVLVNYEYALSDDMNNQEEQIYKTIYEGAAMISVFKEFRKSKIKNIWQDAGFEEVMVKGITKEVIPFMRRLYYLALVPFYLFKLLGCEKKYINVFAAVKSYQLKHLFQYTVIKANKVV
jgi:sterol 24-C-methyltransferase